MKGKYEDSDIGMYFHCNTCMPERPADISPRDWARTECGWTKKGFQVWCIRCEKNIVNLDFKGQKMSVIP